jgi:hypothetical protein
LLTLRGTKIILTVDINCPYIKDNLKTSALKEYSEYLTAFLNSPEQIEILKDNSHLLQAYQQVLDLIELRDIDAVK